MIRKNRWLSPILALAVLTLIAVACAGEQKLPYYGAFVVNGRDLVELAQVESYGVPSSYELEGIPIAPDSQPVIILWQQDTNLRYLQLFSTSPREELRYTAAPKGDGVLELQSVDVLSPGRYCYIQGDPLEMGLPTWCFQVGDVTGSEERTDLPVKTLTPPTALEPTRITVTPADTGNMSEQPEDPAARDGMYSSPPGITIDPDRIYLATFETEKGDIVVELFASKAPNTVSNFIFLARQGFYDSTTFHRVIAGFMAQGGDPTGTGRGGPGYKFDDEFSTDLKHDGPGVLSMANSGRNTNGSQFFITLAATPWLDGQHTVFGKVVDGLDVLNAISLRDPSTATEPGDLLKTIRIQEVPESRLPESTPAALGQTGQIAMPEDPLLRNNLYPARPAMVIDTAKEYQATIKTEKGDIVIELYDDEVPNTVNNFVFLAREGFYDTTTFHRVIADFMVQGGDPTGTGTGGPGYKFEDEFVSTLKHDSPGVLSMANSGANTNGSQFFITLAATPWLDGQHTVFGKVVDGLDVLSQISLRDPSMATTPGDLVQTIEITEGR